MSFYELATLSLDGDTAHSAAPAIVDYVTQPEAQGRLLGLWRTGIGQLNQIVVLREFESRPNLAAERERARRSSNPFNCSKRLTGLDMTSFVPFDFFANVEIGPRGPLYELRTYHLRPAGLSPLETRWRLDAEAGVTDAETLVAMYTMDGQPRLMEVRTFDLLTPAARSLNATNYLTYPCSVAGSHEWLMPEKNSVLLVPLPASPLH